MGKTLFNAFDYFHGIKSSELFYLVSKFDWRNEGFENRFANRFDGIICGLVFCIEKPFWGVQKTIQNDNADVILFAVLAYGYRFDTMEYWQGFHDTSIGDDDRNHDIFFPVLPSHYDA
jgi:hypothetical protein